MPRVAQVEKGGRHKPIDDFGGPVVSRSTSKSLLLSVAEDSKWVRRKSININKRQDWSPSRHIGVSFADHKAEPPPEIYLTHLTHRSCDSILNATRHHFCMRERSP